MLRKMISYCGTLLLTGAAILATPGSGWAHGGGGGGHGGGGGGHGGGFGGGGHFGGGGFGGGGFRGGGFGGGDFRGGDFRGGDFRGGGFRDGDFRGGHFGGFRGGFYGYYPYYGNYPYSYNYYPSDWSGPAYGSGYYDPYSEETPSYPYGYTSVTPPAASYQPSSPAATSQPDTIAHLTVNVPAGARLWLEGTPTTGTGPVRQFDSPPLTPGSRYRYQVRASWDENGHKLTQTQQVEVTAGAHVDVKFPMPPKTAGQTSTLRKG